MKRYLPFIVLGIGLLVVGIVFLSSRKSGTPEPTPIVEESAPELPLEQRPLVSLTPRSDGHWLKLSIANLSKVQGAASIDYLLEYLAGSGTNQGVPGTVKLDGVATIDRDLLLGSESSGKFRYDEGVEEGKLTLSFRDSKGKLLGRLKTEFHLQTAPETITSNDGVFSYKLDKLAKKGYFVTLSTFGLPGEVKGEIANGPFGVFSSETTKFPGKASLSGSTIYHWENNKWVEIKSGTSSDIGVFVSTK